MGQLEWMVGRLRVMPPAELPHRLREQLRRLQDRRSAWRPPPVPPAPDTLPRLPLTLPTLSTTQRAILSADVDALLRPGFVAMGVGWPSGRAWGLDARSGMQWPLSGPPHSLDLSGGDADPRMGWQLLRLQHLQVLALGGALLGRGDARAAAHAHLCDYLAASKPCEGIDYASGIECGLRAVSLLVLSCLLPDPPAATWAALHHHVAWLRRYPSLYSSANNHRIAELCGLYLTGLCAPGLDVGGLDALEVELMDTARDQFHLDGVGAEQSLTYQALTTEWLALCLWAGRKQRRTLAGLEGLLRRSAGFLSAAADDDGNLPKIGDDDESTIVTVTRQEASYPADIAGLVACLLGDPALLPVGWSPDLRTKLLGLALPGDAPRARQSRCFAAGGYTILRQPGVMVVLDHGPLGFRSTGGHGHADALSVWVHARGRPVVVDAGTHSYRHPEPWRRWARSTASHNTVTLDDLDQSTMAGPFNWGRRASARLRRVDLRAGIVEAEHDGYTEALGLRHVRAVALVRGGFDIVDKIEGEGEGGAEAAARLHLAPDLVARTDGGQVHISCDGEAVARVWCADRSLAASVEAGSHSPGYNVAVPAPCLTWRGRASGWTLHWRWAPHFLEGADG